MRRLFALASVALLVQAVYAGSTVTQVVPPAYTNTPGTGTFLGPLANSQRTYQLLIHEDQIAGLVGLDFTALSWRIPASATVDWPPSDATYTDYDIYLSGSVAPADRSLTFADNVVGPQTQVRSGSLLIPAGSYTFGNSPNDFGPEIEFDIPWTYGGGHLLVELRHTGSNVISRSVDALLTSTPGYGTQFSAAWTGNYEGTSGAQGNFSIVRFTAIPEPTSLSLLGAGALIALCRRR